MWRSQNMSREAAQVGNSVGSVAVVGALAVVNGIRAARERAEAERVARHVDRLYADRAIARAVGAAAEGEAAMLRTSLAAARAEIAVLEEEIDDLLDQLAALRAENAPAL